MKSIVFRADASSDIGYGHVVRCISLADELRRHGSEICFICRESPRISINLIQCNGFPVYCIPEGLSAEQDAEFTCNVITENVGYPEYVIVDHYELGMTWEERIRSCSRNLVVIDDYVREHKACDVVINQNYGVSPERYRDVTPKDCKRLTGTAYVLLRREFREIRDNIRRIKRSVRRAFIFFGGSDPSNETRKAIEAMRPISKLGVSSIVLVGGLNSSAKRIRALCESLEDITLHEHRFDIAHIMAEADIAIAGGGVNTWERCCVGLPSIVITQADNQRRHVKQLADDGIVIHAGWHEDVTSSYLSDIIGDVISDEQRLYDMSVDGMKIVDGNGAKRIAKEILG